MAIARNMGLCDVPFKANAASMGNFQYYAVAAASTQGYVKRATGASNPMAIGIQTDNQASAVGDNLSVCMFGPTIAKVAACDSAGNACPVLVGHFLTTGSAGYLLVAASVAECVSAMALEPITANCGIANIEVFWYGTPGASAAVAAC